MMTHPPIPVSGEPLKAQWAGDLIRWIVDFVIPRGDGKSIKTDGNMISMIRQPEECEYRGYFKVSGYLDNGKLRLKIFDGGNEKSIYSGSFTHGQRYSVPVIADIVPPVSAGSIIVTILYVVVSEDPNNTSHLIFSADFGDSIFTYNKVSIPLAELTLADGELTNIRQIHPGGDLIAPGVL